MKRCSYPSPYFQNLTPPRKGKHTSINVRFTLIYPGLGSALTETSLLLTSPIWTIGRGINLATQFYTSYQLVSTNWGYFLLRRGQFHFDITVKARAFLSTGCNRGIHGRFTRNQIWIQVTQINCCVQVTV